MAISFKDGFFNDGAASARLEPVAAPASSPQPRREEPREEAREDRGIPVRLIPVDGSDAPVASNYAAVQPGYGMVYLDFGFLEPSTVLAVQQLARDDSKERPEMVNGRLSTRVVMGYDVLVHLYGQMGQVINALQARDAQVQ
jgi:hypothetical protein